MKRRLLSLIAILMFCNSISAQVGIGTINPEPSAALDVTSSNKGFLPPRLTTIQRNGILNLTPGLTIYNVDKACIEVYNGTTWESLTSSKLPESSNANDILYWDGSEWVNLAIGEEGSILKVVNGALSWVTAASSQVSFGFEDQFNDLTTELQDLKTDFAKVRVKISFGTSLDPNVTEMSLLVSTNPNPVPINSTELTISLSDLNQEYFNESDVNITSLEANTTYYYRVLINGEFVSEDIGFFKTYSHELGDSYQGGILAYLYKPWEDGFVNGQMHGFVVAESDLSVTAAWGCEGTHLAGMITGGSAASTSSQNQAIINNCSDANTAAKLCNNLTLNGYSDWLLPSKDLINGGIRQGDVLNNLTGITSGYYWSCTPHSNNPSTSAWATDLLSGSNIQASKSTSYKIRPVREF